MYMCVFVYSGTCDSSVVVFFLLFYFSCERNRNVFDAIHYMWLCAHVRVRVRSTFNVVFIAKNSKWCRVHLYNLYEADVKKIKK